MKSKQVSSANRPYATLNNKNEYHMAVGVSSFQRIVNTIYTLV